MSAISRAFFGSPDKGKTFLVKQLLREKKNPFVFDPLGEYDNIGTEETTNEASLLASLDNAVNNEAFDSIVMEEYYIYRSVPKFQAAVANAFLTNKHRNADWFIIAQKPHLLPADIRGLCDEYYLFNLDFSDDIGLLNGMEKGLGDAVKLLQAHEFIQKIGTQYTKYTNVGEKLNG